jgi:hypothetical protein
MSVVIPSLRAAVAVPGWAKNVLWRNARAVPSLDLRFADNKSLVDAVTGASLVTFTRASSGTFADSAGVLQTAATDVPRFDHNPTTGESLGLLVEEARTNLLLRSEEFDSASWTVNPGSKTVTANTTVAPNGTLTADTVTANGIPVAHFVDQTVTLTAISYVYTVYAKAGTNNFIQLRASATLGSRYANFDVSTGATGTSANITSSSIEFVGNGWYRCSMVFTSTAATGTLAIILVTSNSAASAEVNSLNTSVILWGAQLEAGAFPTSYIATLPTFVSRASSATFYDSAGIIQTAASGVARSNAFLPDSGGIMRPIGLQLEEARTNLLLRSEEFDNAGTWGVLNVTVTANTQLAPNGTTSAETLTDVNGVTSANVGCFQSVALADITTYAMSCYVKAGTKTTCRVGIRDKAGANILANFNLSAVSTTVGNALSSTIQDVGNGWYRCTAICASATGATSPRGLVFIDTASYTADGTGTIHVWGAQLEAGAFPTSYIATTSATVTRAADVSTSAAATRAADLASITGSAFSSWYRQDEGTVFADVTVLSTAKTNHVISIDDGTTNNRIELRVVGTATIIQHNMSAGGAAQNNGSITVGSDPRRVAALSYRSGDTRLQSGITGATFTGATVPTVTQIQLNKATFTNGEINGTIRRFTFWPIRLAITPLQSITTL